MSSPSSSTSTASSLPPHVLLVALGDGQSKVCQETNRIFKFLKCQFAGLPVNQSNSPLNHLVPTDRENQLILAHTLHDLLFKFWARLLRYLKWKESELESKHISFESDLLHLMNVLRMSRRKSAAHSENADSGIIGDDMNFLSDEDGEDNGEEEEDEEDDEEEQQQQKNNNKTANNGQQQQSENNKQQKTWTKRLKLKPTTAFTTEKSTNDISAVVTSDFCDLLLRVWDQDPLIRRLFNSEESDEYAQSLLDNSIFSEFTYVTCESMIYYLMGDFLPRLKSHLSEGKKLKDFVCDQNDYIFCSYKPDYRDLILNLNGQEVLITTVNLESKDTIAIATLLEQCDLLLFNLDLAIYCRNDLRDIVEMFCAKSRFENMSTHDAIATRARVPPIAFIRSGINNMHMNLARYGLGMLPSEMFDDSLTFLAPEKVKAPKKYISPDVPLKQWTYGNNVPHDENEEGEYLEQLSQDEWSQIIRFIGNPDDMLSLSQVCTTFRQLIDENENFWKGVMIGRSTTFAKEKKREALQNYVLTSTDSSGNALSPSWKRFYLFARQQVHNLLPGEICNFIVANKTLRYVTNQREERLPLIENLPFFDVDSMHLSQLKETLPRAIELAVLHKTAQ